MPWQDTRGYSGGQWGCSRQFGSAHPGSFISVFCDGSVRLSSYSIDLESGKETIPSKFNTDTTIGFESADDTGIREAVVFDVR